MTKSCRFALVMLIALAAAGCVNNTFSTSENIRRYSTDTRVLLMPVDVTLAELSAGGVLEPNAQWTASAESHVNSSLKEFMKTRDAKLVAYNPPAAGDEDVKLHQQIIKLHAAVGHSIRLHQFVTPVQLPTKKDSFEWSLGDDLRALKKSSNADYGLFVHIQDSYASGGRVGVIVMAALFGVAVQGGVQIGFASLVDLNTGQIVWFNRLQRSAGDLRKFKPAKETVETLMTDFPA
jgi:hypothetical protein